MPVDQVGNDANHLIGKTLVTDDDRETYKDYSLPTAGDWKLLTQSHDAVVNPYVAKLTGPTSLLSTWVTGTDPGFKIIAGSGSVNVRPVSIGTNYFFGFPASGGLESRPLQFLTLPSLRADPFAGIPLQNSAETSVGAFGKGFLQGLKDYGATLAITTEHGVCLPFT